MYALYRSTWLGLRIGVIESIYKAKQKAGVSAIDVVAVQSTLAASHLANLAL
jgi:hypothetical protein